jgi:pSer/pThr/pTyr-binding forkhead associated (FHA) protein
MSDELLLGRNPSTDTTGDRAAMKRVKTPGDKVSRVHVEVRLQGWDILIGDCGSTNGTFVVPHSGANVLQLEPGRLQIVEDGATVYFGSRSFQVVGRRGTP